MKLVAAVVSGLLAAAVSSLTWRTVGGSEAADCPACDALFSYLETAPSGERVQITNLQQRGEPKSGTGIAFDWATNALFHACTYLKYYFGRDTCAIHWSSPSPLSEESPNRTLIFEPHRGGEDARCACHNVDSVQIVLSNSFKHTLPVDETCAWAHPKGVSTSGVCNSLKGKPIQSYTDLWRCMHDAECQINDDRLQLVMVRDPRATVVSTYYFRLIHGKQPVKTPTLEEFVFRSLPAICQWVGIRYILFEGLMADKSTVFYYDEIMADPVAFHHRFLHSVGLQLPSEVVKKMADAAARGDFPLGAKKIDLHHGGTNATHKRSVEDEVSEEVLEKMNDVLRAWLPPHLLARFGIAP